ncbi:MAG: efflux RND transporter periplasmic adaptor subunit [Candidatus Margulisiibacteriota bacterium]
MKILLVIVSCFLVIAFGGCAAKKEKPLEIVKVTRGNIQSSIPATGTVMPRNRLEIKPPIAGRIEQVLVVEGQRVQKGEILAWISSLERAALIDAARAGGEGEVKRWEEIYKPAPIVAPINGFIIQRNVEAGQTFTSNDTVLVMADQLIVKAQVDETDIGRIRIGQPVEIVLDAYPKDQIAGRVEHIAYESTVINNVTIYTVDVVPQLVPEFFRSGMSATVNFSQTQRENVLVAPIKAVKKRGKNSYVFKIKTPGGVPEPVQVEAGLENTEHIEIISGLNEGDSVVVPTDEMVKKLGPQRGGPPSFNPFGSQRR